MKSITRVLLILAAIFIVLGGILTAVGLFCGGSAYIGWDKKRHRFVTVENHDYVVSDKIKLEEIKNIEMDLDTENVYLIPTDSDDYYIEYAFYSYDKKLVPYSVDDGTLKVKYSDNIFVFKFGFDFDDDRDSYVKIYYPKDAEFESISAYLDMGSLEISELNCKKLDADLDAGSFEAEKCYFEDASIDLDVGSLEFDHVTIGNKLDADLDMGSAELRLVKDGKKSYGFDLDVDMGDIELRDESKGSKYKSDGDNMITVNCDMGDIEIDVIVDK